MSSQWHNRALRRWKPNNAKCYDHDHDNSLGNRLEEYYNMLPKAMTHQVVSGWRPPLRTVVAAVTLLRTPFEPVVKLRVGKRGDLPNGSLSRVGWPDSARIYFSVRHKMWCLGLHLYQSNFCLRKFQSLRKFGVRTMKHQPPRKWSLSVWQIVCATCGMCQPRNDVG